MSRHDLKTAFTARPQDVLYFVFPNSAFAEGELNLETINTKLKGRAFGLYNKLRGAS